MFVLYIFRDDKKWNLFDQGLKFYHQKNRRRQKP